MNEMTVQTSMKGQDKKLESKYQQVANQLEFTYALIQEKVSSRFHRETIEKGVIRDNLNRLVQKSIGTTLGETEVLKYEPTMIQALRTNIDNLYKEKIDWTRGRFKGQILKIVVRDGQIIEKVFLTHKGTKISVKRSELGLLARLSLRH